MLAAPASTARSSDVESQTYKAISQRESIAKNYNPIISTGMLPMLQLKQHGDCTIVDPRACLNHYDCSADVACVVYVHISKAYFEAMIHAGLIINKTRVVLRCTENDAYVFVNAENPEKEAGKTQRNVEGLIESLKSQQGNCRPGIELLGMNYYFTQPRTFQRKRNSDGKRLPTQAPPATTTIIMNARRWQKRLAEAKKMYECERILHSEQKRNEVNMGCRPDGKQKPSEGRMQVPILVIEAPWMLKPDQVAAQ